MTYTIQISKYDSSRPFAVVAARNFNPVVGRYATKSAAQRRVRDLSREG